MNIFKKTVLILIILITIYTLYLLYLQRMQIKLSMKEGFDNDESKKEYESVKKDEFPSIGPFLPKNYDENIELKQFCIKASYNSAYTGDKYVSLDMISHVIQRGCRFLDFEIYAFDGEPFVAFSEDKENIQTNKLPLMDVLARIDEHAFVPESGNFITPNPNDPMFLHFRIRTDYKESFYTKMNNYVTNTLSSKIYSGSVSEITPISTLMNKYIVIYDTKSSNNYFKGNELLTKNLESNGIKLKSWYENNLLDTGTNPPLIVESQDNKIRTNVEKYQMVVPNNGRGFSFIYYYDNIEPYSVYENYGIQIVCMKFYINDNLKKYEQIFGDLGSAIVPLSYVIENIQNKNDNFFI